MNPPEYSASTTSPTSRGHRGRGFLTNQPPIRRQSQLRRARHLIQDFYNPHGKILRSTLLWQRVSRLLPTMTYVPKELEEEAVIGGEGEQQIVIKSGPKKPKLENLTLLQWSIANLGILYKLVGEGKLTGQSLMDYLSYTTKVYQLVQTCSLTSVLLYDREYQQLQANMGFRWGTDVQHLHTLHLQSRDKLVTQGSALSQRGSHKFPRPQEHTSGT